MEKGAREGSFASSVARGVKRFACMLLKDGENWRVNGFTTRANVVKIRRQNKTPSFEEGVR
jgi:hypothetical protein